MNAGVDEIDYYRPDNADGTAQKVYRIQRTAECWAMMKRAGAIVYPSEKPIELTNHGPPVFYTSNELKYQQNVGQNVSGSKFTGLLLAGGQNMLVYNTHNALMNWYPQKEYAVCTYYLYQSLPISGSIIFGRDMDTVSQILQSDGGKGKRESVLQANTGLVHSFFIPVNDDGIRILRLMLKPDWHNKIVAAILTVEEMARDVPTVECDGAHGERQPIIVACSLDLPRLYRLEKAIVNQAVEAAHVFCFSWQSEVLANYLHGKVNIYEVSLDELEEVMNQCD